MLTSPYSCVKCPMRPKHVSAIVCNNTYSVQESVLIAIPVSRDPLKEVSTVLPVIA